MKMSVHNNFKFLKIVSHSLLRHIQKSQKVKVEVYLIVGNLYFAFHPFFDAARATCKEQSLSY